MFRSSFVLAVLLGVPSAVFAQRNAVTPVGFGGGAVPLTPAIPLPGMIPVSPARFAPGGGVRGGFVQPGFRGPGFPVRGVWGGYGGFGWGLPFYSDPYSTGYGPSVIVVPVDSTPSAPSEPEQAPLILSNEHPAVLVMEFPADAEVWVNGDKADLPATNEWTLTSPVLKAGGEYTFNVKARWKANGRIYEYDRAITVAGGNRSRTIVVAGTEVKE
jgi:uncharacterized protein (TIGR03000 family)